MGVTIPPDGFRMTDPKAVRLWVALRTLIQQAQADLGDDMAFSIILSRIGRELRRRLGPDETAQILHNLASQQTTIATLDRDRQEETVTVMDATSKLVVAVQSALTAVDVFQSMILVMQRTQTLPNPAVLEIAAQACPAVLEQCRAALAMAEQV
jgi:hypothetical protein